MKLMTGETRETRNNERRARENTERKRKHDGMESQETVSMLV